IVLQLSDAVIVQRLSFVFLDNIEAGTIVRFEEGGADHMRTGLNRYRNIDRAIVFALHSVTQPHAGIIDDFHSFAVDKKFNLLARNIAADAEILNRKLVLAI